MEDIYVDHLENGWIYEYWTVPLYYWEVVPVFIVKCNLEFDVLRSPFICFSTNVFRFSCNQLNKLSSRGVLDN
jgi:hypothetical protein